nr:MAG TPA: Kruppel-like factor 3 finger, kruppel-like, DNA BINDING [Caudoviricetes sp.]DAU98495.1 MAG TPA: Kruppel-like factor 3 finger, kruppel-like, DNA BINDING [Caudoviricetes sp.]
MHLHCSICNFSFAHYICNSRESVWLNLRDVHYVIV